jgi:hypothetical protein
MLIEIFRHFFSVKKKVCESEEELLQHRRRNVSRVDHHGVGGVEYYHRDNDYYRDDYRAGNDYRDDGDDYRDVMIIVIMFI